MNIRLPALAVVFTWPLIAVATLSAQPPHSAPAAASPGAVVAVLDVGQVFKNHHSFTRQLEDIKKDIETFEAQINRERQGITEQAKGLEQYRPSSPEYKQLETELAKHTSDIQVRAQLKRNEILDREAKVYYQTYQEMVAVVSRIAEQHGINVVLRFDSEPMDPEDRGKVLKGVNQFVVLQRNLDLTNLVLQQVNAAQTHRTR